MNIFLLYFIEKINSARRNQPSESAPSRRYPGNVRCVYCHVLLTPVMAVDFVNDFQPGPYNHQPYIPMCTYICLNPCCPLIRTLFRRRRLRNNPINNRSNVVINRSTVIVPSHAERSATVENSSSAENSTVNENAAESSISSEDNSKSRCYDGDNEGD